ncbi:MAG: hypothetical protein ABW175_10660 [Bradyrhizobium sp.]
MSSRATKRAVAATDLTEDDSDAARIRQQLDAWAHASPRTPRRGAADVFRIAPPPTRPPPKKRSRAAPAASRAKAPKAIKAQPAEAVQAEIEPEATSVPLEQLPATVEPAMAEVAVPEAVPPVVIVPPPRPARQITSRSFALLAALALAAVAAYFSVAGMAEIFPGDPVAVMVLAGTMEAGKLVIAGWLAAHWRRTGWRLRMVMVSLVAGLALINAAGVFGKLVEAHVSTAASARAGVTERIDALDARVVAQKAVIADLSGRIAQIDQAIDESTKRGRVTRALNIATQERATRDGLDTQRQAATQTLVGLQGQRAALVSERSRVEASTGPIQYLAMMAGIAPEQAVRWLILLMVLCCDPAAIALTVAASASRVREGA